MIIKIRIDLTEINFLLEYLNIKSDEGLVIGLYGVWGEGKTSVLNMIQNDLEEKDDIFVVKFNPWIFKDEDFLILNFLKKTSRLY
ncbi:hypothetical protein GCM10010992_27440 [Cloacibacterium rupense]|uniref:KAP NTPase domain-containing protein n=1 Tax=Cloacibacterium rupense TaxID=517423 RepID=A0ABQ2NLT1_9FLAO|nr:hypothetical protein GCM10010992_27440 [Cloacibacterium rupense]